MRRFLVRVAALAAVAVLTLAGHAQASITRIAGPTDLFYEGRVFVKFDAAFDTINRVYLVVWGTQFWGPTNGLFLNESGAPVGAVFAISAGSSQAGWARTIYSEQEGKFLVSYVKILGLNVHQKAARFVTYAGGMPSLGQEIPIATWGGHQGSESGIAYSVPARKFFVTWWTYSGNLPASFVTTIDPSGTILSTQTVTNSGDGQSDPEIACDAASRRCLVVGWSWGMFNGGKTALWGRFIDDATGTPQGPNSFYLPASGYLESPSLAFSSAAKQFVTAYVSNGQIWGNTADPATSAVSMPYVVRASSVASRGQDGGGYGFPTLTYNSLTQTTLVSMSSWLGYPAVQELDGAGTPIPGSFDFVPDPGPNFDTRNQYTIPAANNASAGFLLLDNHFFTSMRVSVYSANPSAVAPATITALTMTPGTPVPPGSQISLTATASGGRGPLEYKFWRYNYTLRNWTVAQGWSTNNQMTWAPNAFDGGWHKVQAWVRSAGATGDPDDWEEQTFLVQTPAPRLLSLRASSSATGGSGAMVPNNPVTVSALAVGGLSGIVEYQFWRYNTGTARWSLDRPWSTNNSYTWVPATIDEGTHLIQVWVREPDQSSSLQDWTSIELLVSQISAVNLTPQTWTVADGVPMTFTAQASGNPAGYEYKFWRYNVPSGTWTVIRNYEANNTFQWVPTSLDQGANMIQVWIRSAGSSAAYAAWMSTQTITVTPPQ